MIIADRKPLEEILEMIKDFDNIMLVGCKGCVTVCNAGGLKEVEILASTLRIARKKKGRPLQIEERILERQCDPEPTRTNESHANSGGYGTVAKLDPPALPLRSEPSETV